MGILIAFAPFIVFVIVERLFGIPIGLAAGGLSSLGILLFDVAIRKKNVKVLELGTCLLFGGLLLLALIDDAEWSVMAVRLRVDAGLLLIVLFSLAVRRPFTLPYAREEVDRLLWDSREFIRTNYVISAVWALAFTLMVLADIVLIYEPQLPQKIGIIATIVAIVGAVKFTSWYPQRAKA